MAPALGAHGCGAGLRHRHHRRQCPDVDDGRVGSALAIQAFVETLPGIVAPVLFGAAVDHSGYGLAFQTLGVAAFVGVGTVVLVRSQFDIETSVMASSD